MRRQCRSSARASARSRSPLGVRRLPPPLPPPPPCECSGGLTCGTTIPVPPAAAAPPSPLLCRLSRRSLFPSEIHRVSRPLQPPRRACHLRPLGLSASGLSVLRCTLRCLRLRLSDAAATTDAAASSSSASPLFSLKANKHLAAAAIPLPNSPLCGERARERRGTALPLNIPGAHWPPPQGATIQHPGGRSP